MGAELGAQVGMQLGVQVAFFRYSPALEIIIHFV